MAVSTISESSVKNVFNALKNKEPLSASGQPKFQISGNYQKSKLLIPQSATTEDYQPSIKNEQDS